MLDERAIKVGHHVKIVGSVCVILGYKEEQGYLARLVWVLFLNVAIVN